jgi:hypothetical protein
MAVSQVQIVETIRKVFGGRIRRDDLGALSIEELVYLAVALIAAYRDRFLDDTGILREPLGKTLSYLVLAGTGLNGPDFSGDQLVYQSKRLDLHSSPQGKGGRKRITFNVPGFIQELVDETGQTPATQLFLEQVDSWRTFHRTGILPQDQPRITRLGSIEEIVASVRSEHGLTGLVQLIQAASHHLE